MNQGRVVDLRSDTVTRPTPEMRRAMFEAEVGDDSRGEDPTVRRLEERAAGLMGHEAGLFTVSGTMGNLTAIMTHLRPGEAFIAEASAHFVTYEAGGCTAIAGGLPRLVAGTAGRMALEEVEALIQTGDTHRPATTLLCLENTHNLAGGTVLDGAYMEAASELARRHGLKVHLDGERIFNAAVALGVEARALAAGCDSVMFGLSKGLGAPLGSMLTGSREFIGRARVSRQRLGGGLRQAGVVAAAGLVALETMIGRLGEDHAHARLLAEGLHGLRPGLVQLELVQTNIVLLDSRPLGRPAAQLRREFEQAGVRTLATGPNTIRFVTHKDVSREDILYALDTLRPLLSQEG
jgi:threonine aldolase